MLRALVNRTQGIGEAAAHISESGRTRVPDVLWAKILGMRHTLVHACYSIDADAAWPLGAERLPALARQLQAALENETA